MFIKHTNYSEGIFEIDLNENVSQLKMEEPFFGNVELNVKMDKSHHQIVLDCGVHANAKLICDRCGEEYEADLENEFKLFYLFDRNDVDEDDDDVFYLAPDENKINLDQPVKDYAILSIPLKKLCSDQCKGLCPHCAKNLNYGSCNCDNETTNPIWDKLKQIKLNS